MSGNLGRRQRRVDTWYASDSRGAEGGTTLRNGLPGVQTLTTSSGTSYVQRDPQAGLLAW